MSRFDLFYVVVDECDELVDESIARRIVRLHQQRDAAVETDYSSEALLRYIRFGRRINPRVGHDRLRLNLSIVLIVDDF